MSTRFEILVIKFRENLRDRVRWLVLAQANFMDRMPIVPLCFEMTRHDFSRSVRSQPRAYWFLVSCECEVRPRDLGQSSPGQAHFFVEFFWHFQFDESLLAMSYSFFET